MTKMRLTPKGKGEIYEQFWFNPRNSLVYTTQEKPDHGFTSEIGATPIFNAEVAASNMSIIEAAKLNGTLNQSLVDGLPTASLEGDLTSDLEEFDSALSRHRVKEAAMISTDNPAVNVVRIYSQLYGLKDRNYAAVEMARRVATEELILNFDKVIKMEGMEQIPEMTMPRIKSIEYERQLLETNKYGLWIRISDESIRKNVHNPYQDSVTVAGTKVLQRKAFDVAAALDGKLDVVTIAGGGWDSFLADTDRSMNDPTKTLTAAVTQSIEGTNVGGKWDRMGMHPIGGKIYDTNSFLRGIIAPVESTDNAPGTRPLKGFSGVTLVEDQFFPQEKAYLTDVGTEATCILLEGPTRIATKVDEYLATQNYAVIDHHLATVLNPVTGLQINNAYSAIAPPS